MPQLTFGSTPFTWYMPAESKLDEQFGLDQNRATAVLKIDGGPAQRRQAARDFLEYPILTTTNGITYIQRHLPLAYGNPFQPTDPTDTVDEGFWATRFLAGEGKGNKGSFDKTPGDAQATALPFYQYYFYTLEFTDRTYDLLPDSAVLAPGPLNSPATFTLALEANQSSLAAGAYSIELTALTGDGEAPPNGPNTVTVTLPLAQVIKVGWAPVTGAIGYNLYIAPVTIPPSLYVLALNTTGFPDGAGGLQAFLSSSAGASVQPPVANTTAGPLWDAANSVGRPDEGYWLAQGNGRLGGRYITRLDSPSAYPQTIPRGFLQYASGGAIPEGLMKSIPMVQRKLTWHMVPRNAVPVGAIISQLGTLNNAPFDGWPTGTLLFDGIEPRRYRDPLLNRCVDLEYTLVGKPNVNRFGVPMGHNSALKFFPAANGSPAYVDFDWLWSDAGGRGNPPYRSSNFSDLFRPPQS